MAQVKVGMVMVSDGKSRPQPMRLQLCENMLLLQKEEIVNSNITICHQEPPGDSRERVVKVVRQKIGGLGLSIKGGAENKLPILISRIFRDQAADQTGQLFVGDAIIKVNNINVEKVNHDDAVNILRTAGDEVILSVRHYRAATPFLSKSLQRRRNPPQEEPSNRAKDDDLWRVRNMKVPKSPHTPQASVPIRLERKWVDVMTIQLLMAYLTRYMLDTDKLRPNAFEIKSQDGKPSAVVHCDDASMLSEWIKHISNNILQITTQHIKSLNKSLSPSEQILYLGWVNEGTLAPQPWYKWHQKCLAIKGAEFYLYSTPPQTLQDFVNCSSVYKVYQSMFRCLKESEFVDERQNCFMIQTGTSETHYLCAETKADLLRIETAWHRATYNAVTKLGSKTFSVIYKGKTGGLTLDWNMGFALYDTEAKCYAWSYRFSQLKGSSDDGKTKLNLHFQNLETKVIESKELECPALQSLLYCMHAFLTAKVASVDPSFLRGM